MRSLVVLCAALAVASGLALHKERFIGHSVLRINVDSEEHLKTLMEMRAEMLLDVWREPKRIPSTADLRVTPTQREAVIAKLEAAGIKHLPMISDLHSQVIAEEAELAQRTVFKAGDHPSLITTNQYHNYAEISSYLDSVASTYPNLVTVDSIGKSHEGRDMKYVKIGKAGTNKKAAFINGCHHAREWLSCATMIFIIDQLTQNETQYDSMLTNLDVYVMPVLNPDGYAYTWEHDRMWRKTRSGPRQGCYGVDPNRNWNYKWNVAGASTNPCDETYDGPSPNSEVETQHITAFLGANKAALKVYFDIHTYSEDFMYPFGYAEVYPNDLTKIRKVAGQATNAVNSENGEDFRYGSIVDIVYPASGSSIDYTKAVLNIDYSYAMELRPDGNAWNGFVLPTSQILPGAIECWAGIQVVFNAAINDSSA